MVIVYPWKYTCGFRTCIKRLSEIINNVHTVNCSAMRIILFYQYETDENHDYAFKSAHDPFEPIYFWQFIHVICDLAIVIYDTRRVRKEDTYPIGNCGMMASTLFRLLTEHLKPDTIPLSYGTYLYYII